MSNKVENPLALLYTSAIQEQSKRETLLAGLQDSREAIDILIAMAVAEGIEPNSFDHIPSVWNPDEYFIVPANLLGDLRSGTTEEGMVFIREDRVGHFADIHHETIHRAAKLKALKRPADNRLPIPLPKKVLDEIVTERVTRMTNGILLNDGRQILFGVEDEGYVSYTELMQTFYLYSHLESARLDAIFIQASLTGDHTPLMGVIAAELPLRQIFSYQT